MDKRIRSRVLIGCTGAALAFGLTATALSGSAALDSGSFFVKSVNDENASITGIAGMEGSADASNPGGEPGGPSNPSNPVPTEVTPVGTTVPMIENVSRFFAKSDNTLWSGRWEVNAQGDVTEHSPSDRIVGSFRDGNGYMRDASLLSYDGNGNPIAVASWYIGSVQMDGIWRDSGNGYQFLGQLERPAQAQAQTFSMPGGTILHAISTTQEVKIYYAAGFKFEPFTTIQLNGDGPLGNVAVTNDGEIAMTVGNEVRIHNGLEISATFEGKSVVAAPDGGFLIGTPTGLTKVNGDGTKVIYRADFGGEVSQLSLGMNGRVSYLVGDISSSDNPAEIRTLDPSGKQLLWAKNKAIIF